jgi:hypothetical protein
MSNESGILVRAVGRIGYYGGVRRYPFNPPKQRLYPQDRAGQPFEIKSMKDFSDSKRAPEEMKGIRRPPGWMELIEPDAKAASAHSPAPVSAESEKRGPGRPRKVV